jgi:hypothetical protein
MKKIFYLLSITFLLLQSCSSSSNNSENVSSIVLCKRQSWVNGYFDYTYDGNKILTATYGGQLAFKYFYTGDLITKVEDYDSNELIRATIFTYNNNKQLITEVALYYLPETLGFRRTFSYNSSNTISTVEYVGTLSLQNTIIRTGTITLINGEEAIRSFLQIENNTIYTTTKTFDDKNFPFKNVLGVDKIFPSSNVGFAGRKYNVISVNYNNPSSAYNYNYQYNDQGYPISQVSTNGSTSSSCQYFY